ncbi:10_t:CDS:2, partial [Paraglomus brasilianum]
TVNEFSHTDLLSLGKDRSLTWSLLLYLGLLTHGPRERHLRIPNNVIKTEVLEHIISYLYTLDQIRHLIGPAFDSLVNGSVAEFATLLKTFLQTRTLKSLQTASEAVLQGIVELLLDKPTMHVPELWLVVDDTKKYGAGCNGFVDMFIPPQPSGTVGKRTHGIILELKYITLGGLWSGEAEDWNRPYSYKQLEDFKDKIHKEDEQYLLTRKYMHFSKDLKKPVLTTVSAVMEGAVKQLKTYIDIVAKGKGVPDSRIKIGEGIDCIQGHVIMAIAGDHVLLHSTELIPTSNEYHNMMQL